MILHDCHRKLQITDARIVAVAVAVVASAAAAAIAVAGVVITSVHVDPQKVRSKIR